LLKELLAFIRSNLTLTPNALDLQIFKKAACGQECLQAGLAVPIGAAVTQDDLINRTLEAHGALLFILARDHFFNL